MSSVNIVGSNQQVSQQAYSTASKVTSEVGMNQFLELLVTQLQNQDPMNPMDNQQFVAQLATFSSLEQLISINQGVSSLAGLVEENTTATA
jgi:flagellar basal-body rod modification protein FlgD